MQRNRSLVFWAVGVLGGCVVDAPTASNESHVDGVGYAIFRVPGAVGDRLEVALDSGGGGLAIRRDDELSITLPIAARDHARIQVLDREGRPLDKIDADVSPVDGLWLEQLGAGVTVSNFSVHVTREDLLDPLAPARLHADFLDPRGKPIEIRDLEWRLDDSLGTLVPDPDSYFDRVITQRLDAPIALTLCTERQLCWDTTLPLANHAAVIRRTGMVETNVDIGAVANADHTIVLRFMAQFPRSYTAPLFSNGSLGYYDQYTVSIEGSGPRPSTEVSVTLTTAGTNYRYPVSTFELNTGHGNWWTTNPTSAPPPVPSVWHHLAVTRTSNEMRIYLDGTEILPSSGIRPIIPSGLTFTGPVRLGDRPPLPYVPDQQFFGLIDDFGMFSTAKSATDVAVLAGMTRLSPSEPDLVAYDTFDGIGSHATFTGESWSAYVSGSRNATTDQPVLPLPYQLSTLHLPFIAPEVWTVVQEFDTDYSHRGGSAFSWDFIYVPDALVQQAATGGPTGPANGDCTPSIGRRVLATVDATVTEVAYDTTHHGYVKGPANAAPASAPEYTWTEHLAEGSLRPSVGDSISPDTVIGQIHAADCHVHLSYGGADQTFPMAFSDYEVSRDYGRTWSHVSLGMPRIGEWVRRSGKPGRIIDTACTPELSRSDRKRLACP